MEPELSPFCSQYRRAMEVIGGRWTGAILRALLAGETRYGRIAEAIPGLSDRLLSDRLKELEAEGLVVRVVTPTVPVLIEYHPTPKGRSLEGIVRAVAAWAEEWMPAGQPAAACDVLPERPRRSGAKKRPV